MGHLEIEFETMKPISDPTRPNDNSAGYRKIDLYSQANGKKKLYLRILDPQSKVNTYNILAGYTTPYKRDELEDKILDNILVPAMFRCYATPDRNPAMATNPGKGWIYIIRTFKDRDGSDTTELWRELKSLGTGSYQDVNLIENLGTDENQILRKETEHREATCQPAFRVLLPYKVNKDPQQLWIAYSEVQWSLARIQQMLDDVDLREKRMHSVDLSDAENDFENSNCSLIRRAINWWDSKWDEDLEEINEYNDVTGTALLYNAETAPDKISKQLPDNFKEKIPIIYLDDPVGIGRELSANYQKECGRMLKVVGKCQEAAETALKDDTDNPSRWFKSALLLNKHITKDIKNPAPAETILKARIDMQASFGEWMEYCRIKRPAGAIGHNDPRPEVQSYIKEADRLYKCYVAKKETHDKLIRQSDNYDTYVSSIKDIRKSLDDDRFEQVLAVNERTEIRQSMVQAKKFLLAYLEKELKSKTDTPLIHALDDHFSLPVDRDWDRFKRPTQTDGQPRDRTQIHWPNIKADAWRALGALTGWLSKTEYNFDEAFHSHLARWEDRRIDPAILLLRDLADPDRNLALHKRMFPASGGSDLLTPQAQPSDSPAYFQIGQYAPQETRSETDQTKLENDRDEALALFLGNYEELSFTWDRKDSSYTESFDRCYASLMRLVSDYTGITIKKVSCPASDYSDLRRSFKEHPEYFALARGSAILGVKTINESIDTLSPKYQAMLKDIAFEATFVTDNNIEKGNVSIKNTTAEVKEMRLVQNNKKFHNDGSKGRSLVEGTETKVDVHGNQVDMQVTGGAHADGTTHYTRAHIIIGENEMAKMRYIERLKTMERMHASGLGILAIFEVMNTRNAWRAMEKNPDPTQQAKLITDFVGNAFGLVAATKDATVAVGKAVLPTKMHQSFASMKSANLLGKGGNLFGYVSGWITVGMTFNSMMENIIQGDDAYISHAVILAGALWSMVPNGVFAGFLTSLGCGSLLSATLAVAAPLAVVAVGILLLTMVWKESSNIELWAENGPFGSDPFNGYKIGNPLPPARDLSQLHALDRYMEERTNHPLPYSDGTDMAGLFFARLALQNSAQDTHNNHRYAVWGQSPEEAYNALLDAMFRPYLSIISSQASNHSQIITTSVFVPKHLEKSKLFIQLTETTASGSTTTTYEEGLSPENIQDYRRPLSEWTKEDEHQYSFQLQRFETVTLSLKVRLSLYGDNHFVLPYEECYEGTTSADSSNNHWLAFTRECTCA